MVPEIMAPLHVRPSRHVELVELPPAAIHALAAGDLALANRCAPITLTRYFVDGADASVWRYRSGQLVADPSCAGWITRAIWDVDASEAVGRAGYHGPPDETGMVEIGYAVDPGRRRQGFARAALEVLLDRAAREPSVRTARVTIGPDNTASRLLVQQYGFDEVGEQWDDEDGLEIIFEVAAGEPEPVTL
ncbi:MAG: GNAT family N-acetyltransferase [Cellulomonas sp.]